jgi:hypothetical protein
MQIPQSLVLLPSDTDAQKAAKKKKLHSLYCLVKIKQDEEDGRKQQANWLKFRSDMETKKGPKSSSGKSKRASIL